MQQPFQSTLPTRGSDLSMGLGRVRNAHFNPRSPRGGATDTLYKVLAANAISIHAPHEGERRDSREFYILSLRFQSTLPTRGSDMSIFLQQRLWQISIHAPHEGERLNHARFIYQKITFQSTLPTRGSDLFFYYGVTSAINFNPRSPRGGATYTWAYNDV